jgi:hypothetical protein
LTDFDAEVRAAGHWYKFCDEWPLVEALRRSVDTGASAETVVDHPEPT